MNPFDNYEISPCRRLEDEGQPDPKGNTFEVCEPDQAHCWTLYGHIPGEGTMAIGDFPTREDAEEVFQRITGIPFGSHGEIQARLRVMHAGERLLESLKWFVGYCKPIVADERRAHEQALAAIAAATGGVYRAADNQEQAISAQKHVSALQVIKSYLDSIVPPGTPSCYRSTKNAKFIGTGRKRIATASLELFDGQTATIEVFQWEHGLAHRWTSLPGGNVFFEDGRWQREGEAA